METLHFRYLLFTLVLFSSLLAFGQNDSVPFNLTKKYFKGELTDYKSVLTGEAEKQDFNPKKISDKTKLEFEALMLSKDKAVIAISITEGKEHVDLYAFWNKSTDWQITAFRALWLPGFFYTLLDKYQGLDSAGIEMEYKTMFNHAKQKRDTLTDKQIVEELGTLEDFKFEIANMKLTVSSDKELIEHFYKNKDKFFALLKKIQSDSISKAKVWRVNKEPGYKIYLKEILIGGVSGYEGDPIIDFSIGGMIDNSVGYFYCKNPEDVPEMSDNRYIMIRKLGNGWYLYKTT